MLRFVRQLLAAAALVGVVSFLGVGIEHSPFAQAVAPHYGGALRLQLVTRRGQVFAKTEAGSGGHETVTLRRLPNLVASKDGPGEVIDGAVVNRRSGSPTRLTSWPSVVEILVLILALALLVAGIDKLRRLARRHRPRPSPVAVD